MGFGIFTYYKRWFVWTVLTIPMGFIGYYMKKNKWWGILILTPILLLLGGHYYEYLRETMYNFPYHLVSAIFCLITLLLYSVSIFSNKAIKITEVIISILIILTAPFMAFTNKIIYNISVLVSDQEENITFNENYNVYLEDDKLGRVYIKYDENFEIYLLNAEFKNAGKTNLILVDENDIKTIFELTVGNNTFNINKK